MQQLVIQFPLRTSPMDRAEFDSLIALEDELTELSDGTYDVDGHDVGSGEMNIFIFSEDATATFDMIKGHLPSEHVWRAGFRDIDSDEFTALAPSGSTEFNVL